MQIKDDNTVLEKKKCSAQNNREYQVDKGIYHVNRIFNGDKTIKDILCQKITCEYSASHN